MRTQAASDISSLLCPTTKIKLYTTLIVPVLTYGVEVWTITESDESILNTLEIKVLSYILSRLNI